jgi:CrcB protein
MSTGNDPQKETNKRVCRFCPEGLIWTVPEPGRAGRWACDSGEGIETKLIKYLMVGLGGFLGAVARFWLGAYIGNKMGTRFPYGTCVINITGSFVIGMFLTVLTERTHWSPNWRYLVPIGFIGAYTTFSTFEYETLRSVQDGQMGIAFLNVALSVIVGFAAVWLGVVAGRAVA